MGARRFAVAVPLPAAPSAGSTRAYWKRCRNGSTRRPSLTAKLCPRRPSNRAFPHGHLGLTRWLRECLLRGCGQAFQSGRNGRLATFRRKSDQAHYNKPPTYRAGLWQPERWRCSVPDSARDESASAFMIGRDTADSADTCSDQQRRHDEVSAVSTVSRLQRQCENCNVAQSDVMLTVGNDAGYPALSVTGILPARRFPAPRSSPCPWFPAPDTPR
jgi:hypothetical protein